MIHLTTSTNRKPSVLSKRISAAGFGAVAAAALMFSTGAAEAAKVPKELALLQTELATTFNKKTDSTNPAELATQAELQAAVQTIVNANASNKKFKLGVFLGYALKTQAAVSNNAGDEIAAGAIAGLGGSPASTVLIKMVGDAAKTAATGKGAIPFEISSFVTQAFDPADANVQNYVLAAAEIARSSKTAVGEIIAGYAIQVPSDQLDDVAAAALGNKKLAGAVTEISREVGSLLQDNSDAADFALTLAKLKAPNASKVAAGVVAAKPDQAGAVTDALVGDSSLKSTLIKGMAGYAKTVAAVADIEQISVIGAVLSREIGANSPGAKFGVAGGLAKTLVQAIIAKPATTEELNAQRGALSANNRVDEIAEVAAYVVGGIMDNATFVKDTKGKKIQSAVLSVIKGAIAGVKTKDKSLASIVAAVTQVQSPTAEGTRNLFADIAGSVANTLRGTAYDTDALLTFLTSSKTLKSIAGKDTALQTVVANAIRLGLDPENYASTDYPSGIDEADARLEDGKPSNSTGLQALLTALVDPETDNRNF